MIDAQLLDFMKAGCSTFARAPMFGWPHGRDASDIELPIIVSCHRSCHMSLNSVMATTGQLVVAEFIQDR